MINPLDIRDLGPDATKVLRVILHKLLSEMHGKDTVTDQEVDSTIELIEKGFVKLKSDGKDHYWLEPVDLDPKRSHSIGTHPHNIASQLLSAASTSRPIAEGDDRPLIDHLQAATFGDDVSMRYVADKYAFRSLLRQAHCFAIDTPTSALIADFSLAIASDLESARRLAIPPFPVTWFDIDNRARLQRIKSLGVQLTNTAQRDDVLPRVGWLIHPAKDLRDNGFYATYCAQLDQGCFVAPLSFFWQIGEPTTDPDLDNDKPGDTQSIAKVTFGVDPTGVHAIDAFPCCAPFHLNYKDGRRSRGYPRAVYDVMTEISGELRHIWGLLIALGASQLGAESTTAPQPRPSTPPFEAKGKTLFAIEHKVLTIKLSKRTTADKVAMRAITAAKKRWHEVRGHFRALKNPDGTVRKRVPVKPHHRGEERLGRIEKTYKVEK